MFLIHKTVIYCMILFILSSALSVAAKKPVKPIKKAPTSQVVKRKAVVKKPKPSATKPKPIVVKPVPVLTEPVKQPVFRLESARYGLEPFATSDGVLVPNAKQKMLILSITGQELPTDTTSDKLKITASDGSSQWPAAYINRTSTSGQQFTAAFLVPANTKVNQVNINIEDKTLPLLLNGNISGFSAPLADSSDPAIPLVRISAATGAFYPAGTLLIKLDKTGYTFGPVDGKQSADDARFVTLDFTVKNPLASPLSISPAMFDTILEDADGALVKVKMSPASSIIESQNESIIRFYGQLATDNHASSFSIRQGNEGRQYIFNLDGVN